MPLIPQGVNFDGADAHLTRDSDLSGIMDGKIVSGSFFFKTLGGITMTVYGNAAARFNVGIETANENRLIFSGRSTAAASVLLIKTDNTYIDGEWHSCQFCFDMSDSAKRFVYIDDIAESLIITSYNNVDIDFTQTDHFLGNDATGFGPWAGDLAEFCLYIGTYIDFSVEANRRKFIDSFAKAVPLGPDGSYPTGSPPDVCFTGRFSDWATNKGSGGGFTEQGTLARAETNPPHTGGVTPNLVGL